MFRMESNNKPVRKRKETGRYVFPNIMVKMMKGVSQRTQYEAEMLSLTFILVGLITMGIFTIFFTGASVFFKVLIGVNAVAGFVFLSSRLVTSFQQYQQFLLAMGIIQEWNEEETQELNECKEV